MSFEEFVTGFTGEKSLYLWVDKLDMVYGIYWSINDEIQLMHNNYPSFRTRQTKTTNISFLH